MCDVGGKDGGGRENEDSWQRWLRGDIERIGSRAPADSWSLGGGVGPLRCRERKRGWRLMWVGEVGHKKLRKLSSDGSVLWGNEKKAVR